MDEDNFDAECSRVSRMVDPEGTEEREWAATGGALIEEAVSYAVIAFQSRPDLRFAETPTVDRSRSFFIKTMVGEGVPLVKVCFKAQGSNIVMWAENVKDSPVSVDERRHYSNDGVPLNGPWVRTVLAQILSELNIRN